ncbi:MAG: FemAB family PEP-CTERM system-associated protein [Planctomycetes bacterium]|nr:FemAB family PEP-CTERM system-associated protein [Planctomycetota bacterium]
MNGRQEFISVVVPVTTSEIDVRALLEGYSSPLRNGGYEFELIFVLDGVHPTVVQELEAASDEFPIKIVRLQGEGLGEAIALSAGVARARGRLIVNAPQYLQSEPQDLIKLVEAMQTGADFVATWRHPRVDPWLNRLQSRIFNWLLRVVMGIRFHDLNSSLRGMRRQVLEDVNVYGEMYRFLPVLAQRQGFRVVEVKVRHREEKGRRGFYGVGVYVRRLLDILAITFLTRFTQRPLRFFGMLGLMTMVVGAVLCSKPVWDKLTMKGGLSDHPIFVLGMILIAFGFQLVGFGLVGEIIIFTQSGSLRNYKIDEILEGGAELGAAPPVERRIESPEVRDEDLPITVRELVPGEDARWDSFVHSHPDGTFFHLTGWRRVVVETFGHEPHYLVAEQGRRWVGVLPLFWFKSPFVGNQIISLPYAVYGGVLAVDEAAQTELFAVAQRIGRQLGAKYIELRHLGERPGERSSSDLYLTFRRELPSTVDQVMPSIKKRARAEVRRARDRHGLTCVESTDLGKFFELFARDKKRLGSPTLPYRWFRALTEEFGRQIVVHNVIDDDDRVLVSVMSFCFKDCVYAYYAGADLAARGTGANDYIYCKIMEWAVERGFRVFDFGRSRRDSGAAKFKKNMGFEPEQLHYEYILLAEDAELPSFNPSNPRLERPRQIWSKLPLCMANSLGGKLSRYLP